MGLLAGIVLMMQAVEKCVTLPGTYACLQVMPQYLLKPKLRKPDKGLKE
jgi:hypothetical protein